MSCSWLRWTGFLLLCYRLLCFYSKALFSMLLTNVLQRCCSHLFITCWKPLILLSNKTEKHNISIENSSNEIKGPQFLCCDYVGCLYILCALATAYTVCASNIKFEPWCLYVSYSHFPLYIEATTSLIMTNNI